MKKKDAYYFPHDSNAKDDPKCTELIESLGMEGYGIYWVLIETLRDQAEYKYPIKLLPAIARRYSTTADKVKAVVINYGLFKHDDEQFFFSESLIERMMLYDTKKEQARLAANARWNVKKLECIGNASALHEHSDSNAIKENKIKENKIKEDKKVYVDLGENYKDVKLTQEEINKLKEKYGVEKTKDMIEGLMLYIGSKGNKYKSHYLTLLNWERKNEKVV